MIKVINIFGAPGCGKSTTAAGLFWRMKCANMSVELVSEYAKACVFEERDNLIKEDQLYIFTKQHRALFRIKDTYEYAIMDSPIVLSSLYRSYDSFYDKEMFDELVFSTFTKYDNKNFLILLEDDNYEERGRVHSLSDSKKLQNRMWNMLYQRDIRFTTCRRKNAVDKIFKTIKEEDSC